MKISRRVRCPCCGMLVWASQINKSHDIDVLDMSRIKARGGFKYVPSSDQGLVELVKNKIKALYERYFESTVLRPVIRARASILLEPGVVVFPGVRSGE